MITALLRSFVFSGPANRGEVSPRVVLSALLVASLQAGCVGYRYGTTALYQQNIRTIHVPMVRTDSFRVELGPQFTEILQKRIEDRTPFKLADASTADSVFICRIINDTKQVVTETVTDEPRDLLVGISIETNWTDRFGNVLMQNRFLPPRIGFLLYRSDALGSGGTSSSHSGGARFLLVPR
jgi:hypothetical protein